MINQIENPVEWATLVYELTDAREHLTNLIRDIESQSDYSTENLSIDLGHVFAHLNRAWFRHNKTGELSDAQWDDASQFPQNLIPVG